MLAKIKQLNPVQLLLLSVIVSLPFSAWPTWHLTVSGRDASVELPMLTIGLTAIYFIYSYGAELFAICTKRPWVWLVAWALIGTLVAIIRTDNPVVIIFYALYTAVLLVFGLGITKAVRSRKVSLNWLLNSWVYVAAASALLGIGQFVLAAFTSFQPIREAYAVGVFSFPRIHGAALEPLFFAQWLVVPTLYLVIRQLQRKTVVRYQSWLLALLITVVVLTLARSALVALTLTTLVYGLYARPAKQAILQFSELLVTALMLAFLLIGASSVRNSNLSFFGGIGRYLDHASGGIFNSAGAQNIESTTVGEGDNQKQTFVSITGIDDQGVVEASTLGRLEVIRFALDTWQDSPTNIVVGVGKNRFGEAAAQRDPDVYLDNQVVNNQYIETLVETGIVGLVLIGLFVVDLLVLLWRHSQVLAWLLLATLIQFAFFSNILVFPLWLLLGLAIGSLSTKQLAEPLLKRSGS